MWAARDTIEPIKALQQSGNGGEVPSATSRCCYPLLVQLGRDGLDGDKARFPKFTNCWAKGLSSHVNDPLACQFTVDSTFRHEQIQAPKHPNYSGAMPPTANGARYSPSVQLIRQATLRNEACRDQHSNGRQQNEGAGIRSALDPNASCTLRLRDEVLPRTCSASCRDKSSCVRCAMLIPTTEGALRTAA